MAGLRLLQHLLLFGLRPVGEHFTSKPLYLFNRHGFGFIGSRTVGNRLIHLVGYLLQPIVSVRPILETLVQTFGSGFFFGKFIAHELLYLYTTSKSTISNLRILDRQ